MKNSPETSQPNLIKYGDRFALGSHSLLCGDATDVTLVEQFLTGQKINAVITDCPYGIAYVENKSDFKQQLGHTKIIANDQEQTEEEYKEFTKRWLLPVRPFLEKKNSVYIFNSDKMIFALRQAMIESGFKFCQLLIWIKNTSVVGRLDYLPQHELIAYGWYGTHEFKKSKDKSVLLCPKPTKSKLHPTMKPISLLRRLILNSTSIGDTVYDCFGGSGSLITAAEQTRRKCLMIELDPAYCQTIIDRFERLTRIKAVKLN
ncbi:MAG: site-specific DNA-methyltransferase [Patescibacteria group bacterium]|nr:site-specific DNA-methyltransferase [Patescibacteria group bacterium]